LGAAVAILRSLGQRFEHDRIQVPAQPPRQLVLRRASIRAGVLPQLRAGPFDLGGRHRKVTEPANSIPNDRRLATTVFVTPARLSPGYRPRTD
jgi:hypothetical protein